MELGAAKTAATPAGLAQTGIQVVAEAGARDDLNMKLEAVIFDLYHTLLQVLPPPPDTPQRWHHLWLKLGRTSAPMPLPEFDRRCRQAAATAQAVRRAQGIDFPEDDWLEVARQAAPDLATLSESELEKFLYEHAKLQRTVRLMPGAAEVLASLAGQLPLGLCSNCQAYTKRELAKALQPEGLSSLLFESDLCFYSYRAGFRKPSPAAFAWLAERLVARDIAESHVLMVGDRIDNDMLPAQARTWQTWHLSASPKQEAGGDWYQLGKTLNRHMSWNNPQGTQLVRTTLCCAGRNPKAEIRRPKEIRSPNSE